MKRIIKIILFICVSFYTFFLWFLYFFQNSLVYLPSEKDFYDCDYFVEEEKKQYKGTRFYERKGEKTWVIVFFHGNAWRACDRQKIAEVFERSWFWYILVEYSWYAEGSSEKQPDIENILKNADDIGEYVKESWYGEIMSAWRSIWTWPASYLAWKINTERLLLISPYSQLYKVAAAQYPIFPIKQLFTQNYNSQEYLKNYLWNVFIVHGNNDRVVPQVFWRELFDWLITTNKKYLDVERWSHNNELYIKWVDDKIIDFLK